MSAAPFKTCGCGLAYSTRREWNALPYGGRWEIDRGEVLELRHCMCGSTLAVDAPAIAPLESPVFATNALGC